MKVTNAMQRNPLLAGVLAGLAAIVLAVFLIAAWMDGGREPLREISHPVPLPEAPR